MIFVLLAALAVGVACYFGIDALGTAAIDRWYLSDDAIAARNLEHARSLQEYVSARGVSSRDTLAIEQWSRGEKKANVIVYQAEGDPYEAGSWGTSELLDDTTQSDIADLGYSFFTLQFADGEYRVAVCDYSEAWLYSYVRFGALVLGCRPKDYPALLDGAPGAKIAAWWDRAVDVIPAGGGKGIGIEKMLAYYGLDKAEALAFGDGNNDREMLQAVGTGVAMENGSPELKALADEICGPVYEDGIYHYCADKGLI